MKSKFMADLKTMIKSALVIAALVWGAGNACLAQTPPANLSPDLQEIVKLSQQKMSDDIITSFIKNSGKTYKLGADDIIYLSGQGVSQAVIATMLQNSPAAANPVAPTPVPVGVSPIPATEGTSSVLQPPPVVTNPTVPEPVAASSIPGTPPTSYIPSSSPAPIPASSYATTAPAFVPPPVGLQDNFFADGALNPNLWQTQSPLLSALASLSGPQVLPELSFTSAGMQMSGIRREGQFMGIQSLASFSAPFNFNVTVTGLSQSAIPFEVYLVSPDLQHWVSIAGHLGGRGEKPRGGVTVGGAYEHGFGAVHVPLGGSARSPEYGVWVNHTGSGQSIAGLGYKIFENPMAGLPYTVQVSVGLDGLASVTFLDAVRTVVGGQTVPLGSGPFYIVLAGRDGAAYANWLSVQLISTAPVVAVAPAPAVPAVPTLAYFQSQLAPYGTWVTLPQYGLCWQPAVGPVWRPYYDGGSWTYTDAGWYWQSDYPWGDIAFHYGRWAYTVTGWVWVPGYDYAPAWVVWRHADEDGYVGWAPLVPGAVFINGSWQYNGVRVAADFDFGIGAGFFVFVDGGHFCDRDFHPYVVPHDRMAYVYGRSTYVNHYRYEHGRYYNEGIDREHLVRITRQDPRPVPIEEIRHQEEQRNVAVRHEDIHAYQSGARPDGQRTVPPPHGTYNNNGSHPPTNQKAPPNGGQKNGNQEGKEYKNNP